MKNLLLIFFIVIVSSCVVKNTKYFAKIQTSTIKNYGYKPENPICIWNSDVVHSGFTVEYFLTHLRSAKGNKLIIQNRYSVKNPLFSKYEEIKNSSPLVQYNTQGHRPIIDEYEMIVENEKDTIKLFINPYIKKPVMIPYGLQYVN